MIVDPTCPCGEVIDGGTPVYINPRTGEATPLKDPSQKHLAEYAPGQAVICSYCYRINKVTNTGVLVEMSAFDFAKQPKPVRVELRRMAHAIRAAKRRRN